MNNCEQVWKKYSCWLLDNVLFYFVWNKTCEGRIATCMLLPSSKDYHILLINTCTFEKSTDLELTWQYGGFTIHSPIWWHYSVWSISCDSFWEKSTKIPGVVIYPWRWGDLIRNFWAGKVWMALNPGSNSAPIPKSSVYSLCFGHVGHFLTLTNH